MSLYPPSSSQTVGPFFHPCLLRPDAEIHSLVPPQANGERIRIDTHSQVARVIRPGQAVTMDYSAARVNVHVNERNAITGVTCG